MPLSDREKPPKRSTDDPIDRIEKSLDTLIPNDANRPYDMHELIEKIVDEHDFELQPDFACNIIIGFAHMGGMPVE